MMIRLYQLGFIHVISMIAFSAPAFAEGPPPRCQRPMFALGGGAVAVANRGPALPYEDEINAVLAKPEEYQSKKRLLEKYRETQKVKMDWYKDQIEQHMCNLSFQAKLYGTERVVLEEAIAKDKQCEPEGKYIHQKQSTALINQHSHIKEKYARVKALVDCLNKIEKALGKNRIETLPEYQLKLYETVNGEPDGAFRFSEKGNDKEIVCNVKAPAERLIGAILADDFGVKISPQVACLLKKDGWWDGRSEKLTPPTVDEKDPPKVGGDVQSGTQLIHGAIDKLPH